MKTDYAKQWKDAKARFENTTGAKKASESQRKLLTVTLRKGSGVEKSLKAFDAAMKKRSRKAAAAAYQKVWQTTSAYQTGVVIKIVNQIPDPNHPLAQAYRQLSHDISTITSQLGSSLRKLQQEKGETMLVHQFLADVVAEEKLFQKAVGRDKAAKSAEKKHKVAKQLRPIVKLFENYTKSAGRGEADKVREQLQDYQGLASDFTKHCNRVLAEVKTDGGLRGYSNAVDALQKLVVQIRNGRAKDQLDSLLQWES